MEWGVRSQLSAVSAAILCSACVTGRVTGGDVAGTFVVDPYPSVVTTAALPLSGFKPMGSGVSIDGVVGVPPDVNRTWRLDLGLSNGDGPYTFTLRPVSAPSAADVSVEVTVILDSTPPGITATSPAADADDVPIDTTVTLSFTEPIDCSRVSSASAALYFQGSSLVPTTIACDEGTTAGAVILTPIAALQYGSRYSVVVFDTISDLAGNHLAKGASWQFDTADAPDTTPPTPPTASSPAAPASSSCARVTVGGTKEVQSSVEARWLVTGVEQQAWTVIVPLDAETRWSFVFELAAGSNTYQLRSKDAAGNGSSPVTSFTVTRQALTQPLTAPTLCTSTSTVVAGFCESVRDWVPSTTDAQQIVLRGTKPANTGVWNGTTALSPLSAATTWSALVTLEPGANAFDLVSRDCADNVSAASPTTTVTYVPAGIVTGGGVDIGFTIADLWAQLGDEYNVSQTGNDIDHFSVDVWIEGPLPRFPDGAGGTTYESCVYDDASLQRKHTRYVSTVARTAGGSCVNAVPAQPCFGLWDMDDYRNPNYLAALIEAGHWATATHPIARSVDRRNVSGLTWGKGTPPACDQHLWYDGGLATCQSRMMQPPAIDGMTQATLSADYPSNKLTLGTWSRAVSYHWDLKDANGALVPAGAYLVSAVIAVDRRPAAALATDVETCWDRSTHDARGSHRVEGVVEVGGSTPTSANLVEKGLTEYVHACVQTAGNDISCSCSVLDTTFPCPSPNSLYNASSPPPVRYLQGGATLTYTP